MGAEPVTVLYNESAVAVPSEAVFVDGRDLWLHPAALADATGWHVEPHGFCRDTTCLPLVGGVAALVDEQRGVNLSGLARRLGQGVASEGLVWAFSEPAGRRGDVRESLIAPDFALPDFDGRTHRLSDYRGKKVLLYCWGSYCGCAFDLPGWEAIYQELRDQDFVMIAVALDAGGAAAAERHVRTGPDTLARSLRRLVIWWDDETWQRGGVPTYPCLLDTEHRVAELFGITNIPMAVWIDERGRIVRPAEPAGFDDGFRRAGEEYWLTGGDPAPNQDALQTRAAYVAGLRDWVANGSASSAIFTPDEVRERLDQANPDHARAAAHARLGAHLRRMGDGDGAQRHFERAAELRPESWEYFRQSLVVADGRVGTFANDPAWWERVTALGDKPYFAPIDMQGMPTAVAGSAVSD